MEDNNMIQNFILTKIVEEEIQAEYKELSDIYEVFDWDNETILDQTILTDRNKESSNFRRLIKNTFELEKTLEVDIDSRTLNGKSTSPIIEEQYILVHDVVFRKMLRFINGKAYGYFDFITLYKLNRNDNHIQATPLASREITYNGIDVKESKPIYYLEENYQNIETIEDGNIIKRVLTKKN